MPRGWKGKKLTPEAGKAGVGVCEVRVAKDGRPDLVEVMDASGTSHDDMPSARKALTGAAPQTRVPAGSVRSRPVMEPVQWVATRLGHHRMAAHSRAGSSHELLASLRRWAAAEEEEEAEEPFPARSRQQAAAVVVGAARAVHRRGAELAAGAWQPPVRPQDQDVVHPEHRDGDQLQHRGRSRARRRPGVEAEERRGRQQGAGEGGVPDPRGCRPAGR